KREMTIRDLMRHTSGLTYGMPNGSPVEKLYIANKVVNPGNNLADMVAKLGKMPLQYQPGTRFHYSISSDVLRRVIAVASGKPLDGSSRARIFRPLDRRDPASIVSDDQPDRSPAIYRREKGPLKFVDAPPTSRYHTRRKFLSGGGGLVSTARDYARFCQM